MRKQCDELSIDLLVSIIYADHVMNYKTKEEL